MQVALRLLGNLLRIGLWPLWFAGQRLRRPKARWVEVRFAPSLVEVVGARPFWQRLLRQKARGLRSLVELRRLGARIAEDPRIDGVLCYVPALNAGWATCKSARDALLALRAAGKRVVVYLPLGGGNRELYVALAADRLLVSPRAPLSLIGLSSQMVYAKPLLDRAGIAAEVIACGEYKTAGEALVREHMTEPQREQMSALLAGLQSELEQAVAQRLSSPEAARALFERGVWGTDAALAAGVIDGCRYEDELTQELAPSAPQPVRPVRHTRYLAFRESRLWRPVRSRPAVAVISVAGAITHGERRLPAGRSAAQKPLVGALRRAARDPRIAGVILYVNSPGGSALASDLIHREILRLRAKKPIVAYLGDVAASGGYYVAAPCQRVVAQPTCVTGSIGVVSVRLIGAALIERLGLRAHTLKAAPHADMGSPFRVLDATEQTMVQAETDAIYQAFIAVVAEGRGRSLEEIERVARGRVWSGADALRCGLVDELGGFERALLGLKELAPALRELPLERITLTELTGGADEPPPPEPTQAETPHAALLADVLPRLPIELGQFLGGIESALYYAWLPRFY